MINNKALVQGLGSLALTAEAASTELGFVVPEIYVNIAKSAANGFAPQQIAEIYGVEVDEVMGLSADEEYLQVFKWVSMKTNQQSMETDEMWDDLEHNSVKNLVEVARRSKDPELNLKMATIANKAVRRQGARGSRPLDGNAGGAQRTVLTLTKRLVQKFMEPGQPQAAPGTPAGGAAVAGGTVVGPIGASHGTLAGPLADGFELAGTLELSETLGIEIKQTQEDRNHAMAESMEISDADLIGGLFRDE